MIEGEAEIGKEGSDQGEDADQWLRERERDNSDRQSVRLGSGNTVTTAHKSHRHLPCITNLPPAMQLHGNWSDPSPSPDSTHSLFCPIHSLRTWRVVSQIHAQRHKADRAPDTTVRQLWCTLHVVCHAVAVKCVLA